MASQPKSGKMSKGKKRSAEEAPAQPSKGGKRRKGNVDQEHLDSELGINKIFSAMDNALLADYLAQKVTRFAGELSKVEVADLSVGSTCIQDTTSWTQDRTTEKIPEFLEYFSEDKEALKKAPKKKGELHTLVVAGAGLRAADIVRVMRRFQTKDNAVAKLFAKHMKVEEQVTFLKNKKSGIGVGTPARLADLIENGALSVAKLQRLVIDASHIDQKKRGIMDMKDTMMPLAAFLAREELKNKYADDKRPLQLMFY